MHDTIEYAERIEYGTLRRRIVLAAALTNMVAAYSGGRILTGYVDAARAALAAHQKGVQS